MEIDVARAGVAAIEGTTPQLPLSVHLAGIAGLVVIFLIGTLRPVNLGVLALVMTFLVGTLAARETPAEMYRGFPVDLFVLLAGVTYLFAIADRNGTLARIVEGSVRLAGGRRRLIPWVGVRRRRRRRPWPARSGRPAWRCWRRSRCGSPSAARIDRRHDRPDGRARRGRGQLLAAQRARRDRAAGGDEPRAADVGVVALLPPTSPTTSRSARSS